MHKEIWEKVIKYIKDQTTSSTVAGYNTISRISPSADKRKKKFKRLIK